MFELGTLFYRTYKRASFINLADSETLRLIRSRGQ